MCGLPARRSATCRRVSGVIGFLGESHPLSWVPANRGDNLRRLDAAAWSNPRYQPIGSRLRGLELRTKGSLPIERAREAAVIAIQGPCKKTPATYIRSSPRHRLLPSAIKLRPSNFLPRGISAFILARCLLIDDRGATVMNGI